MARNIAYIEHQQGSTKMIVYSGGEIEVQSGGLVDLQSGSSVTVNGALNITGTLEKESTGKVYVKGYTTHATTADGRLTNWGHSYIVPTSSGIKFRMSAPEAGIDKYITVNSTIRAAICATTASGGKGQYFGIVVASTERKIVMKHLGGGNAEGVGHTVHLRGMSTKRWCVMNRPSTLGVQFTTST